MSKSRRERTTLPSVQEMLSDLQFEERLREQPQVPMHTSPRPIATPEISARTFPRPTHSPRREDLSLQHPSRSPGVSTTTRRSSDASSRGTSRIAPYHDPRSPRPVGSAALQDSHDAPSDTVVPPLNNINIQGPPVSSQYPVGMELPTYVLPPDKLPPDDDRRHGCGICHRRFNRPSSLMIHMNSHTGAQPFECPFPGCTRRFSVNSNMRRHYRNHRESATVSGPTHIQTHPPSYYRSPGPSRPYYPSHSSPSTSSQSSFADTEDGADPVIGLSDEYHSHTRSQTRLTRSQSAAYLPAQTRPVMRPRSCTVPGCNCSEAPSALRPAFQQGSSVCSSRGHR